VIEEGLRLMSVHAHADDETITMGGTLALCADRGIATCNICCTDGKLATIVDPSMPEEETRPRLAEIRQEELRAAMGILGVDEVVFLEYGDSGMPGAETNKLPDAFWMASLDEVAGRLVGHIRRFKPHVVVTYDANGAYGHPDHIQAHRATVLAVQAAHCAVYPEAGPPWLVRKLYYTAFPVSAMKRMVADSKKLGLDAPFGVEDAEELPFLTPDHLVTTAVDCRTTLRRKREALRAHRSQIGPDWPMLAVPEEIALQYADEYFQLVLSAGGATAHETDLFEGITAESAVPA
jgi:N-acetyl-1-D-myo-inositol-2-amino-2-deoxy-alpha-D-glucopyranoside deacetylase